MSTLDALPIETLLGEATAGIDRWPVPPEVRRWIAELAGESDTNSRCGLLFHSLRKQIDTPLFSSMARGVVAGAVRGDAGSIAVLAAFASVDAPGEMLIENVREFSNLHREAERLHRSVAAGNPLGRSEQALLETLDAIDATLAARWEGPDPDAGIRDRGAAWRCRRAFAEIADELRSRGTLEPESLRRFLDLGRLELDALEIRAGELAGAINPYSARQVSHVMPILGAVDEDLRDMRRFLSRLEETRQSSLFHEQFPSLSNHLDDAYERRLRDRISQEDHLQLLWRVLRGIDRNPLSTRTLAFFVDHLLDVGDVLVAAGLRKRPIDVLSALVMVLDHHDDGRVEFMATGRVVEALHADPIEGVEAGNGFVRIDLDPTAARRLSLPQGLPVPARLEAEEAEEEKDQAETVKDLVMANMNSTSVLLGLLKNQKVINSPGIVRMVVERTRNMRVLDTVCMARNLHSGFANKDVPLAILRSPMNIPIKELRKFVNVRYVSKMDLRRLARDKSAVRREVAAEVEAYLKSLA